MNSKPNHYLSIFTTGFSEVVHDALMTSCQDCTIQTIEDGMVIYSSFEKPAIVQKMRFLNNSFVLLAHAKSHPDSGVEKTIGKLLKKVKITTALNYAPISEAHNFGIVISKENEMITIEKSAREVVEQQFSKMLKMPVEKTKPGVEIWFMFRRGDDAYCGLRFTGLARDSKVHREKGELKRELANLMCLLSEPTVNDIVLDPFSGWGAIPIERAIAFPYTQIIAGEKDTEAVSKLQKRVGENDVKIEVCALDATSMPSIESNSVSTIITDPPWGMHDMQGTDFIEFYTKMLNEFLRVLRSPGTIILLTGRKREFEKAVDTFRNNLKLEGWFDTLVARKKTRVYKLRKADSV